MAERAMFGRSVIYTDAETVTRANVVSILTDALAVHQKNSSDIQYLYDYYRGKQPILEREKDVQSEICNKVVENRANEIVAFKVGYLLGDPVQYVNRTGDDEITEKINALNEFVFYEDKASKDKELADWFHICGTSYRMALPSKEESPFSVFTLDPRYAFVVYHSGLGNKPVMGVKYVKKQDDTIVYSVYTDKEYFEIEDNGDLAIRKHETHILGMIPIIEYPANTARLGAFEIVLPILDAINATASDRMDGIDRFVQAFLMFKGVDIDAEDFAKLKDLGGLKVPVDGDVKYLTQELNQTQTQTLVDYMYQTVLTICGMPSQSSGDTSDSSNNGAVIVKNGWQGAEARAKDTELMFKRSEKQFLRLALRIMSVFRQIELKVSDIDIRFTRRNYENIQEKSQVLLTMLNSDKVHPRLAFAHCGMFADPEVAYTMSMEYAKEVEAETERMLAESVAAEVNRAKEDV